MTAADSLSVKVKSLRCEYLVDPQGIDERFPRLSWRIEGERRGLRQVAYRIRVATTPERLANNQPDLWDSGTVESDRTTHIAYAGNALASRMACYWDVHIRDDADGTAHSEVASWTMGLLEASDWAAQWIAAPEDVWHEDSEAIRPTLTEPGTPIWFRREFDVPAQVRRATLYATARGVFEFHLGERKVGRDCLAPEWTDYDKRLQYRTYDVTEQVRPGKNVLGAVLGDGWWSGYVGWQETRGRYGSLENSLFGQLEVELETGERLTLSTDGSWSCGTGPILSSDFMMGEIYDARREWDGWLRAGGTPQNWSFVRVVPPLKVPLVAQRGQPVRVTEFIEPATVKEHRPGVHIIDLGQNISGWVRLRVSAPAGTRVTIRHGERLSPDGSLYTENLRRAKSTDVYICRGAGEEVWEPRFTFHGFQYVEITGLPGSLPPGAVIGCVVHSATPPTGWFECSHPGVNRLWQNGLWSQRDNFLSVPTDCPQRDERLGWMGDAQVFLRTATYNMDVAAFFTKWMIDVEDAQTPEGIFPDVAPRLREKENFVGLDGLCGAAGWADAGVVVPWTIWRVYGDRRIIERHWGAMVAWLDYLERTNPEGLRVNDLGNNYGDWLCIPSDTTFRTHSPMKNLLATAYWADDAAKLSIMARELGRAREAKRFEEMFERVRAAFQKEFVRPDGRLSVETQTAYLLALVFNLLPESLREPAAKHLVENIRALDWHLSTGFIGISHLQPTLTSAGQVDVAYRLLLQEDYPSWLYPVLHGATTIWERWNGWTEKDGFFNPHMNSFNHYSLGSIGEWFFRQVAGIELDPKEPGFKRIQLKPYPGGGLAHAKATFQSIHGEIASAWQRRGDVFVWSIRVPPNTRALVSVPAEPESTVTERDLPLEHAPGVRVLGRDGDWVNCEVGSGSYEFHSVWKR